GSARRAAEVWDDVAKEGSSGVAWSPRSARRSCASLREATAILRSGGEYGSQLLQGAAHLRLDGAHGAVGHLGDLLVGQLAVLPEQEDLLFLRAQVQQRLAELLQRLALLQVAGGRRRVGRGHDLAPQQRSGPPPPGAPLEVLGGVEADAEDPRPQVVHLGQPVLGAPAAEEDLLGDVLGVLGVIEDEPERADQLVP